MSFIADEEILQDFLLEAGEILEQLSAQLIELESCAQDTDLLNAIFRGFHTVKGGAGFLQLQALVACCHAAENVFDSLRKGLIGVSAELMDSVLAALDALATMFDEVKQRKEPTPADKTLLDTLAKLAGAGEDPVLASALPAPMPAAPDAAGSDEISEDEFEALLDQLHGKKTVPVALQAEQSAATEKTADLISDNEFEALLDQLHGAGKFNPQLVATPAKEEPPKAASKAQTSTVRVDTAQLDDIMNLVGELVLVRNRLLRLAAQSSDEVMVKTLANLDLVTADLQNAVMKTRMQPIKKVFGRFPRLVRDMARSLGKEIALELVGEDTALDKNLVEALADPLVHLVRNAVDHGIEMPDVREDKGKPRSGRIVLQAEQEGDHILLCISDDGAGMNPELLRRKAVEKGLLDKDTAARLSKEDCYNLIFAAGFSTCSEVSDISGRGVGMDVVKTQITRLNGSIHIESQPGQGTRIAIKLPLTLAIMPTLMVLLGGQAFAFPLVNVSEIFQLDLSASHQVDGQEMVLIRGQALPLFYPQRWLVQGACCEKPEQAHVVVLSIGNQRAGFVVDQLIGQEEVVIKPLGKMLHGTPGMAGATITGDGRIGLILDVPGLLTHYARQKRG
ncbi:chemotaxis protein CheA [Ventosimonas gracilis]|uniref:Chemotaxis protein CheA n=1 Tax=Ventosimonas gracilis TaxID=1680762 RepID=A0A139SHK0_9GAMM|nr:chemotaxis protein CheA [Ventosimonas gracilis]KXU33960.1 chemotaxis protein CheA [Ventosimonas gracilis]